MSRTRWGATDGLEAQPALLGRSRDCSILEGLLDQARAGPGAALVVRGESGVGKTALLQHMHERASGCRVVSVSAAQSEAQLAFAALHQLCAPLFDGLDCLPGPQREALAVAFGQTEGVPADSFFLGLAVVSLLSAAADERPLVCLVDDSQWSDPESSHVLGFVARRRPDSVALVVAGSDQRSEFGGVPELHVRSLSDRDARTVLMSELRAPMDEQVRERIVAESKGNPLALLEVARRVAPLQLAGGFGEPDAGIVGSPADVKIARQLDTLPEASRRLLLVAAAEPLGNPLLLWHAAEQLGIPSEAAGAAREAGLVEVAARVRFRDPLLRAAIYRLASPQERCMAHGALADATDVRSDPERHAWHRALAASTPDETVAAELELSSRGAAERGGLAAEAAFLQRAAMLSPGAADRARRAVASAEIAQQAGDPDGALETLITAEAGPLNEVGRARAELLRARVAFSAGAADAPRRLFAAATRLEPLDIDLAREAYLDAFAATVRLGSGEGCDPVDVADSALAARRSGPPRPSDLLLDGLALQVTKGYAAAAPTLRRALKAFGSNDCSGGDGLDAASLASHVASALWQHDAQLAVAERHVRFARETGALPELRHALAELASIHLREGELAEADAILHEQEADAVPTHHEPSMHVAIMLAAYRGLEAETRRLIGEMRAHLTHESRGLAAMVVQLAGLVLNNGLGRYEDALRDGRGAFEDLEPVARAAWALPELVEAGARAGADELAADALHRLSERAAVSGTNWGLGLEARSHALLCKGAEAEDLYREAIARLAAPGSRIDLARAHLLYGEWLRRAGRRVDARAQLRVAHGMLSDIGAGAFAERAERELRATGETVRKRTDDTRGDLTAQERQIAELAVSGLSNPEIGTRLFISPRTVEWHLRKVFRKLGVSSRFALRDALPDETAVSV